MKQSPVLEKSTYGNLTQELIHVFEFHSLKIFKSDLFIKTYSFSVYVGVQTLYDLILVPLENHTSHALYFSLVCYTVGKESADFCLKLVSIRDMATLMP